VKFGKYSSVTLAEVLSHSVVQKTTNNTCMVHSVLWLRLFLPQDLFIDMESDRQTTCCMTLCSKIVVMYVFSISGLNL
jgi:hypothetical protein